MPNGRLAVSTENWYDPSALVGAQIRKVKQTPAPAIGVFVSESEMTPAKVRIGDTGAVGVG
jgi:hypothetical protein